MAVTPIISRVPPQHRQKLMTPLDDASASALRQMGVNKLLRPVMTPETEATLISAGYARRSTGGLILSDEGAVRAMMENGQ
jgi:hypothetical protein